MLQTDRMVKSKVFRLSRNPLRIELSRPLVVHAAIHFILALLFSISYFIPRHQWLDAILVTTVTGVSHLLIDVLKLVADGSWAQGGRYRKLWLFFIDQFLHISVIFGLLFILDQASDNRIWAGLRTLINGGAIHLNAALRLLVMLIVGICATAVSGIVVEMVVVPMPGVKRKSAEEDVTVEPGPLENLDDKQVFDEQVPRGRLIGYLERLIVVLMVWTGNYSAVGLIVAAKSLARFKKLDHQEWAEYFLVGTLCSLLCGTLCGFALKLFLNSPVGR